MLVFATPMKQIAFPLGYYCLKRIEIVVRVRECFLVYNFHEIFTMKRCHGGDCRVSTVLQRRVTAFTCTFTFYCAIEFAFHRYTRIPGLTWSYWLCGLKVSLASLLSSNWLGPKLKPGLKFGLYKKFWPLNLFLGFPHIFDDVIDFN